MSQNALGNYSEVQINALTKIFLFISHPNFIFCGLFVCPCSFRRPKNSSGDVFESTDSIRTF